MIGEEISSFPVVSKLDAVEAPRTLVTSGVALWVAVRVGDGEIVDRDVERVDALANAMVVEFAKELDA